MRREIMGLENCGINKIVQELEIPPDANKNTGRVFIGMKSEGTKDEMNKARFIPQSHRDREKVYIIHNAVSVRLRSVRLVVTLGLSLGSDFWIEDPNHAYYQGSPLTRAVYVNAD